MQRFSATDHLFMNTSVNTGQSPDVTLSERTTRFNEDLPDPLMMRAIQAETTSPLAKLLRGMTSSIRLLPDFLIIGTQRGGTTALYHYIKTHPCIEPATATEIHFFDKRFSKALGWYRGHFPTRIAKYYAECLRGRPFVTGEASSSYLFHPHAPKRVAKVIPHVKLIVLLRNPVDRAYSQYFHAVELGHETHATFEQAIEGEEGRTAREREKLLQDEHYYSSAYKHLSYLTRGIYVDQLRAWMDIFPREQFLILKSEEFYADPLAAFKQVAAFLNLPQAEPRIKKQAYKQYEHNTYSSQMDPALRKRLSEYFEPHNARLYEFLGIDFGWDK
jgi:hypothetical protein